MALDQWTCEPFDIKSVFRHPVKEKGGKFGWKGAFSCPSNALAALMEYMDAEELEIEKKDELIDVFSNSMERIDGEGGDRYTIKKSPHYSELIRYGGNRTPEQYTQLIEEELQRRIYVQRIPKDLESKKAAIQRAGLMFHMKIPCGLSSTHSPLMTLATFPRGDTQMIEFLQEESKNPKVIYFGSGGMFGIGDPNMFNLPQFLNLKASSLFGGVPIYGDITVFKKKPFVLNSMGNENKSRKRKINTSPDSEVVEKKKRKKEKVDKNSELALVKDLEEALKNNRPLDLPQDPPQPQPQDPQLYLPQYLPPTHPHYSTQDIPGEFEDNFELI